MKILYINHYAGSPKYGMEFRPYYLSKEWVKLGHDVSIIGANNSHLRTVQPSVTKDFTEENMDGINYIWLKTPKYHSSGLKRIVNIITFVCKLFKYRKRIVRNLNPDVVIASSTYPLDIYPSYLIAKKSNAKLIFELHDMWPLSPMLIGGYSKYHPFIWLMQKAENFACRNSHGYVSMLGNSEEYLVQHGLQPRKFSHVTNGFLEEDWVNNNEPIPEEHTMLFDKLKAENKLIAGYAGGHAPSNSLDILIKAAASIHNQEIAFVLVGKGPIKQELIEKVNSLNLSNVHFLPPVNKTAIPDLLKNFDIAFIAGIKSELHKYGTAANKVTDYMLAEKPIIFAVDEPNCLIERVGCGIQIPAENEAELVNTIKLLSMMTIEERAQMGNKGREYALQELNYTSLAKKFIEAISKY